MNGSRNGIGDGIHSSSTNHFIRLKKSASTVPMYANRPSPTSSPVLSDELNDTRHLTKGRGVLASMNDLNVAPVGRLAFLSSLTIMEVCLRT